MSTLTIDLDSETARLVEEAARVAKQPIQEWVRLSISQAAAREVRAAEPLRRVAPLHPNAMVAADDFNNPLEQFEPYA
jgi:hypothetical protein